VIDSRARKLALEPITRGAPRVLLSITTHVRRFIRTCARNIIYGTVDHKQPICDAAASIADRMSGSIAIDSLRRRRAIIREDDD